MFNKIQFCTLFFFIFIVGHLSLVGQNTPVTVVKSTVITTYQGKQYYQHSVLAGQTLYSICKAYSITDQDIAAANPSVSLATLSVGQVIRIPVNSNNLNPATLGAVNVSSNCFYHKVEAKQTVFYLHQLYNVSVEEIYKLNPGSENGLQLGQLVCIPKSAESGIHNGQVTTISLPDNKNTYLVKPGDTLYSLAQQFGLTEADIFYANESLRWGLKAGMVITIPEKSSNIFFSDNFMDSTLVVSGTAGLSKRKCDSIQKQTAGRQIRMALLLPFFSSESFVTDSLTLSDSVDDAEVKTSDNTFKGRGAVEFYEGVLLALDSLRNSGISINLFVYDTEADTNKIKKILKELDIIHPDLILGPFTLENAKLISIFSTKNMIPLVVPLLKDDPFVRKNPYLFQVTPSMANEQENNLDFLMQYRNENIVLVSKKSMLGMDKRLAFKTALINKMAKTNIIDTINIKEIISDGITPATLKKVLAKDKKNVVVILSTDEPETISVLNQLHTLRQYYDVTVLGQPIWHKFKNVRIDYYHDLQVTIATPFFIDYSDPKVKSFILKSRSKLGNEPFKTSSKGTGYNFTYLGYDLGLFFIPLIANYNTNLCDCMMSISNPQILSEYKFKRSTSGCFENQSLNFVQYRKDLTIHRLDLPIQAK